MTYTLFYVSADSTKPGSTWSVWREEYADVTDDEPIEGTQEWVSQHADEAAADAEACRLQRMGVQP